ncbi:unnamed protein product [Urochloa decumbens]|uniref:Ubiquitin-like protease family profile domain-containing protein n=1 Tax=Urochloa decumbens TaxID=240449 RepID=A0ABC8VMX8_9POAL
MTYDRSYVVDYLTKTFQKIAMKKLIMFAHNNDGHWIAMVVILKFRKVLYFDSSRSKAQDHKLLKEAFGTHCVLMKIATNNNGSSLKHVTKFPCHQQPPGNACGFYTVNRIMKAMELLDVKEFEVPTTPLDIDVLHGIREKIASFLMDQVVSEKGEFHCVNPGVF